MEEKKAHAVGWRQRHLDPGSGAAGLGVLIREDGSAQREALGPVDLQTGRRCPAGPTPQVAARLAGMGLSKTECEILRRSDVARPGIWLEKAWKWPSRVASRCGNTEACDTRCNWPGRQRWLLASSVCGTSDIVRW